MPKTATTTKKPKTTTPPPNGATPRTGDLLVAVILDKSGSMTAVKSATISAYNEFKATQAREGKKLGATTQWALTLFDTEVTRHDAVAASAAPKLTEKTYVPGGCTALYDAVGETLNQLEAAHKRGELPAHVLVAIQSDGQENSSREWTQKMVFDLIGRLKDTGTFAFVYLGADQDAFVAGGAMNISRGNTISYDSHTQTQQTFAMTSAAATNYRTGRSAAANLYAPLTPTPATGTHAAEDGTDDED